LSKHLTVIAVAYLTFVSVRFLVISKVYIGELEVLANSLT